MPTSRFLIVGFALATLDCFHASAQSPGGMSDLGTLGGAFALATGVSADGSIVVGNAARAGGGSSGFVWSEATGMQDIGVGALQQISVQSVSADGQFVWGLAFVGLRRQAFRWSAATGFERLGDLGPIPGLAVGESVPLASSDDGSVVVGWSLSSQGAQRAFRWSVGTGIVDLGTLGGSTAEAIYVSGDGEVVVGHSYLASGELRTFRWQASTGMVDLGTLGGHFTAVGGINADGSVIVGHSMTPSSAMHAYRWTAATGLVDLGTLGGASSAATAVSADGTAVAGSAAFGSSSAGRAFFWTAAQGMVDLGTLGGQQSDAQAISADGKVIVGVARGSVGLAWRGFRWTASGGMHELGTFGGAHSTPEGVSSDGSVVVGTSSTLTANRAFRWELGSIVTIGDRYCQNAVANSTGLTGRCDVFGSNALAFNDSELMASQLPTQVTGFFLASRTTDNVLAAGGGLGTLCLGGAIGRFAGAGQIQTSGAAGSFRFRINLDELPQPLGTVQAAHGETWNFQAWHRDAVAGVPTSNLTDAVAVTYR